MMGKSGRDEAQPSTAGRPGCGHPGSKKSGNGVKARFTAGGLGASWFLKDLGELHESLLKRENPDAGFLPLVFATVEQVTLCHGIVGFLTRADRSGRPARIGWIS